MNIDFYQLYNLSPEDSTIIKNVRTFMEEKVAPIINDYWLKDEFPTHLVPEFGKLDICGKSALLTGLIVQEMGRIDPSIATFYNIQNGLVIGSLPEGHELIPSLKKFEKIGCFALTEPESGSDCAKGLKTTARKTGFGWILNGQKKWVGNSTWCDISIVWTDVGAFIVNNKTSGFTVEKIKDKFGLKVCQNGLITLKNVRVADEDTLETNFKDVLYYTRYLVSCEAIGCQIGAYENTLKYAKERKQFGKPIASFQLIQDMLAKMLTNITACQCLVYQLGKLIDEGKMIPAQASLCKSFCTARLRETVAMGREIFGANGLSIDYNIGRFFTDAEAIFTYEGSYQMNNLILGKSITGIGAFI